MRIRTIKPEFFKDEDLAELPALTRILFAGLWCMADRRGRLHDKPKRIRAEIVPYDDCDVDAMLNELARIGVIERYEVKGDRYIQVETFEKHQRITGRESETESEIPAATKRKNTETFGKHSGNIRETTRTTGREGKGRDIGKEGNITAVAEEIYDAYPRKEKRPSGVKAITKALASPPPGITAEDWPQVLMERTKAYAVARQGEPETYTPHPATWFNEQRYNDDPKFWKSNTPAQNGKSHQSTHAPSNFAAFRNAPEREDTSQQTGRLF